MCQSWVFGQICWLPDPVPHLKGPSRKGNPFALIRAVFNPRSWISWRCPQISSHWNLIYVGPFVANSWCGCHEVIDLFKMDVDTCLEKHGDGVWVDGATNELYFQKRRVSPFPLLFASGVQIPMPCTERTRKRNETIPLVEATGRNRSRLAKIWIFGRLASQWSHWFHSSSQQSL